MWLSGFPGISCWTGQNWIVLITAASSGLQVGAQLSNTWDDLGKGEYWFGGWEFDTRDGWGVSSDWLVSIPKAGLQGSPLLSLSLRGSPSRVTKAQIPKHQKYRKGLPWWLSGKESPWQCRRYGFNPWLRKIPHIVDQLSSCTTTTELVL